VRPGLRIFHSGEIQTGRGALVQFRRRAYSDLYLDARRTDWHHWGADETGNRRYAAPDQMEAGGSC